MRNFSPKCVVIVVFITLMLVGFGSVVSYASQKRAKMLCEYVVLAQKTDSAKHAMECAEEEMYCQAAHLNNELVADGALEYVSDSTRQLIGANDYHTPSLEYFKAAISDMLNAVDPDGDRFDDCDYRMAWKAASEAEARYAQLSAELSEMNKMLNR